MNELEFLNRFNTCSMKWDGQTLLFGEEGLLPFWVADMDIRMSESVSLALKRKIDEGVLGYYAVPSSYYEAVIAWETARYDRVLRREMICFAPGVKAAINWLLLTYTAIGEAVIVFTPVYYPFMEAVENNRRKLICSDLHNTAGHYSIDFDDFERKVVQNDVKLLIFSSPHNPVGRVWTAAELRRLVDICERHDVVILSDEIYHDITLGGRKHVVMANVATRHDKLVTCISASKTFNLSGCQNAFVVIEDEGMRRRYDDFVCRQQPDMGNLLGYVAVEAAYRGAGSWLAAVLQLVEANYAFVVDRFAAALPQVVVSPLEGTYLAWIDFAAYLRGDELADFMQRRCRLAFDYGSWFGGVGSASRVRMNLATSPQNVAVAVERIVAGLK